MVNAGNASEPLTPLIISTTEVFTEHETDSKVRNRTTRTIRITEEAYERLERLRKKKKISFSDVILEHSQKRRTLSEVLSDLVDCTILADDIELESGEIRKAGSRRFKV
ncbi:MAG TPA: antitoxin VapB family protein [Methanoregulaceae archaeon]|nr:antitoxin VapB family protein [Methanoregulaceae archaeon]